MFPKEIWNVVWGYYQSYNVYELNQDFKASYKWDDLRNRGIWKKNGCSINFFQVDRYVDSTTWKKGSLGLCCNSFILNKSQNYRLPPRYSTTLIESDLNESERANMLINKV